MPNTGFSARVVQKLAGISYRQLDHWDNTGLVGSSIRRAAGKGSRRVYSFEDLVALRVVARLRAGASIQAIRRAVECLKKYHAQPLSTLYLVAQGNRILALTDDPGRMVEANKHGQVVITIAIEPIRRDLTEEVRIISAPRELEVTVRGRGYRVVLTPDLEAGGFTVTVPELPGCISESDTVSEARRMAREAIEEWLDVDVTVPKGSRRHAAR